MTRKDLLDRLNVLHDLMSRARDLTRQRDAHAKELYEYHASAANMLWDMIQAREGKYKTDDTAQAWTRIMHEHYLQAKIVWDLMFSGPLVGMKYTPPAPSYVGRAS